MENCNSIEDANGGALDPDVGMSNKIPRAVYATTISKEEYPFGTPILATRLENAKSINAHSVDIRGAVIRIRLFESCHSNVVSGHRPNQFEDILCRAPTEGHTQHPLSDQRQISQGRLHRDGWTRIAPIVLQSRFGCYIRGQMDVGYNVVPLRAHGDFQRCN